MKIAFKKADKGLLDWTITKWTGGPYTHCIMIFNDTSVFEAAPFKGCHWKASFIYDLSYDYLILNLSDEEETTIKSFCNKVNGRGYDWTGVLLSQIIPLSIDEPKRFYCSELITKCLHKIGLLLDIKPTATNPANLIRLLNIETIGTKYKVK